MSMSGAAEALRLKQKKKSTSLVGYLKKELHISKAKMSARKLAESAGVVLRSYEREETEKSLISQGLIVTEEIALLVRSILSGEGSGTKESTGTFELRRKGKMAPLIHRRRVWWEPVPEATSYGVYVSKDKTLFEPGRFSWETTPGILSRMVIGKAELIIPDEWPEFPTEPGTYYIGITSKDDLGNQSDPILLSGHFKFIAPPAPSRGGIDCL
ncbi:MAG TPA: hypothetical protein VLZ10_01515 [Thermodesulfobacteriota bacterium]|nr:hypothetical protein [Thermodesulfobacteriota bacterium]